MEKQRMRGLQALRGMTAALLLALFLPLIACADMGPKPSVRITFRGLGGEVCYGTLGTVMRRRPVIMKVTINIKSGKPSSGMRMPTAISSCNGCSGAMKPKA